MRRKKYSVPDYFNSQIYTHNEKNLNISTENSASKNDEKTINKCSQNTTQKNEYCKTQEKINTPSAHQSSPINTQLLAALTLAEIFMNNNS